MKVKEKPAFNNDQLVSSSKASKNFGQLRKQAKEEPLFITEHGNIDSVLMDYEYYEKIYQRILELEEMLEEEILVKRIEKIEKNPSSTVSWKDVKRTRNINNGG